MTFGRQRAVPPDLWTDERLIELPVPVKWTAISLHMFADDHGRQTRRDWMLRRAVYPQDELSREEFDSHLLALAEAGWIVLYEVDGSEVYQVSGWPSTSHAKPSKFPPPPLPENRRQPAGSFPADRRVEEERGRESERGGESREGEPFQQPTAGPPSAFCRRHQPHGVEAPCRDCGTARLASEEWWRRNPDGIEHPDREDD